MAKFRAISFNCNGIGEKIKDKKIFTYINDKIKHGFCFLQETHSTSTDENKWKSKWNGNIYFSHGSSNSTGCAILLSKQFPIKIVKESRDMDGRLHMLEMNDEKFLLINYLQYKH